MTLALGPLTLPVALLLGLLSYFVGSFAGERAGRRAGVAVEPLLMRLALVGLVVARLAFVFQFRDAYLQSPLGIIDIRDGGWSPLPGLAAAGIYATFEGLRRSALRKPLGVALGTGAAIWLAGSLAMEAAKNEPAGLPALQLQAVSGEWIALDSYAGKPTVVNLWATWCPPCRREMPVLQQAQAERPDVNFVFLNQGESAAKVRAYMAAENLPLRNMLLDVRGEARAQFGLNGLPSTLFLDAQGRLTGTRVGELSRATLQQRLPAPPLAAKEP